MKIFYPELFATNFYCSRYILKPFVLFTLEFIAILVFLKAITPKVLNFVTEMRRDCSSPIQNFHNNQIFKIRHYANLIQIKVPESQIALNIIYLTNKNN